MCSIGRLRSQRSPRPHALEATASLSGTALASRRAPADSLPLSAAPVAGSTVQAGTVEYARRRFHRSRLASRSGRCSPGHPLPRPRRRFCSHYARALLRALRARGWCGAVAHFRGCSGTPNRLPRAYHSGDYAEIDWILRRFAHEHPHGARFAVGVSLGGNALLKWLAVTRLEAASVILAAAAVSAPMDLSVTGHILGQGFNRLYTRHFLQTLKPKFLAKLARFPGLYDARRSCPRAQLVRVRQRRNCTVAWFSGHGRLLDECQQQTRPAQHCAADSYTQCAQRSIPPRPHLPDATEVSSQVRLDFRKRAAMWALFPEPSRAISIGCPRGCWPSSTKPPSLSTAGCGSVFVDRACGKAVGGIIATVPTRCSSHVSYFSGDFQGLRYPRHRRQDADASGSRVDRARHRLAGSRRSPRRKWSSDAMGGFPAPTCRRRSVAACRQAVST